MSDDDDSLIVHKNSYKILVDRRLLPGYVPTPEEAAENERRRIEYEVRLKVVVADFESARGRWAVLSADEGQPGVLRELLAMHVPTTHYSPDSNDPTRRTWVQCAECRDGDDNAMWPCSTARVLAKHYAIEMPEWGEWLLVRDVLPE